ncbi:MAG: hypothetical protein UR28_C0037G0020 [Candidatus Peregrinibacteria bacterium GW2011_GWF2_33_10]|uniref:DUF192 domain-containing protein n=2 Tax=Candidatus Nomuraibacteriota TaxID=1752729 RepID=A0A0G0DV30_9BACT|nr:MAG: hypothetical protein UR28_C0037G0020 [Candidatus Peregrinibacteria bacterium GW2011_GWF2_33_10]KKP72964.1 MAG: hypothetical protein UR70_C0002G0033 [Candidatus Nomurabacteria bacterium GW2011_GWB1_35_20]KKP75582.1 MAG: hypothetical protein UR72_C0004G0040 [Parcubacteria group bacterium GW2011_GWC1_35_21]KKP78354.1 MAG: hypothetical protein UR77_C0004G0069 [Candidatus Nomurabacteria bacterium GW2011_GWC2_35_35]KKP98424.1 MAG: hypothetical protein US05_C0004G0055 [Candidatus Nomurabacteri
MQNRNIFFILVVIVFLVIEFFLIKNNSPKNVEVNQIHFVKIAGKILKVDLALTLEEQEQGLSGRNKLREDESMLFVFDYINKHPFWMKDMNFAIDIIWIGENLRVVYIKKNAQPESYPETFLPKQDAKYVLEVLSQFSEKNNLKEGDRVEFLPS